tara:strand:- start:59 stop:694 length:636 start_codon:yes stop_codon:yes gene_type:complete
MEFKIEQILPLIIYKFQYPNIEELLSISNDLVNETYVKNGINYRTTNSKLHKCKRYKKLHNWFHACLQVVKDQSDYKCDELKITSSWANKFEPGQHFHPHIHSNSVVSGIFYFEKIDVPTHFLMKDPWTVGMSDNCFQASASSLVLSKMETNGRYNIHEVQPDYGTLCLFPSNLIHGCNSTKTTRRTLAFNSFPSGKIGSDEYASINIEVK